MLENAISKTYNLLASGRNFPARMIVGFAKEFPEEVRSMFRELFDETTDVVKRIQTFNQKSAILLEKYSIPANQHFQGEIWCSKVCKLSQNGGSFRTYHRRAGLCKAEQYQRQHHPEKSLD